MNTPPSPPTVDCEQSHPLLRVGDIQAAVAFYTSKLGFSRGFLWGDPPEMAGVNLGTMRQEAFELHALLEGAQIPGPYVLVGQSIGGLLVCLYAKQYGSNVVGMVPVDPTHESSVLGSVRYVGWVRLREKAVAGRLVPEPWRHGKGSWEYRREDDYMAEEFQQ